MRRVNANWNSRLKFPGGSTKGNSLFSVVKITGFFMTGFLAPAFLGITLGILCLFYPPPTNHCPPSRLDLRDKG
jgi:hypothetical protein